MSRRHQVENWTTEAALSQLHTRGWVDRSLEARPDEERVLVRLWHPNERMGEGTDRYRGPVETVRSLPLGGPLQPPQILLFDDAKESR
jgi:hypothetical protein